MLGTVIAARLIPRRLKMRIFKYVLEITDVQTITAPRIFKFLHVGEQDGYLCLWAATSGQTRQYLITIVGTGHEWPRELLENYVGTAQVGSLVWHVFANDVLSSKGQK